MKDEGLKQSDREDAVPSEGTRTAVPLSPRGLSVWGEPCFCSLAVTHPSQRALSWGYLKTWEWTGERGRCCLLSFNEAERPHYLPSANC